MADTRYASAKSLYEKGYLNEPELLIEQAINFYPYELNYLNLASKIYSDKALEFAIADEVDTAYDYYTKTIYSSNSVIKNNPFSTIYLADRANVLSQLQRFDENMLPAAILSLDRQSQLAPTDPRPLYNLAILNARIKNFDLTFDYLNKAILLKKDYHDAHRAMALYHYQQAYDENKKLISPAHLKEAIEAIKSYPESFPTSDWTPILDAWQTEYSSVKK